MMGSSPFSLEDNYEPVILQCKGNLAAGILVGSSGSDNPEDELRRRLRRSSRHMAGKAITSLTVGELEPLRERALMRLRAQPSVPEPLGALPGSAGRECRAVPLPPATSRE